MNDMTIDEALRLSPFLDNGFSNCPDFEQGRDCLRDAAKGFLNINLDRIKQLSQQGQSGRLVVNS